ncbi:hypothetical protein GGF42_003372, partial [Coemansia sp. RSA 2424]
MASLIDAVGECLVRLGSGNYDGSLAIVDGYLGQTSAMEASDSEAEPDYGGPHPLGVSIERRAALRSDDNYSESSSFSDAESFRDASSSPFWQDATHPPFRAGDDDHESDAAAGRAHMHTAESVLGSLRQLVQRERGWAREKAAYETHLAQMAVQLEQQSQVLQASAECSPATSAEPAVAPAAAASSHPTTAPAPATGDIGHPDESTTRGPTIQPSTNWWSAFLPAGATAMTHIPAFMALPTLSAGTSRFPAPSPACAVVPATGEEACLECIQACERVAEAVLNGDFSARVRCSRCHSAPTADNEDDDDTEWPMLPKSGYGGQPGPASTPLINRPATHTQKLANRVNRMASLLSFVTSEILNVAHNDGVCGNLGSQGRVDGLKGKWLGVMNEVNAMTTTHAEQVRDIAHVCASVANGDLAKKVTMEANGEMLKLKSTVNGMVEQLGVFSLDISQLTRAVATGDHIDAVVTVPGLSGVWKDLNDSVNNMAFSMTNQVREIANVTKAICSGDLSQKVTSELSGEMGELATTINTMVDHLSVFVKDVIRVTHEVGVEGRLGAQVCCPGIRGVWKDVTISINVLALNITHQVRTISEVTASIADGDLGKMIDIPCRGEMVFLKFNLNGMVGRLMTLSNEVSRVAREVGTDGDLGGQAIVPDVDGIWKDLTDNVNKMAANLTTQVRDIATVTKAVAKGDLTQK